MSNTVPLAAALLSEPVHLEPIHRVSIQDQEGVEASVTFTGTHRRLKLQLDDDRIKDLRNALLRSLNTWDNPPAWLMELSDMVDAKPPSPPAQSIAP